MKQKKISIKDAVRTYLTNSKKRALTQTLTRDVEKLLRSRQLYFRTEEDYEMLDREYLEYIFDDSRWTDDRERVVPFSLRFVNNTYVEYDGLVYSLYDTTAIMNKKLVAKLVNDDIDEISKLIGPNEKKAFRNLINRKFNPNMCQRYYEEGFVKRNLSLNPSLANTMFFDTHRLILEKIPDDFTMLYPEARSITRHFVLHVGPTNSGKTYNAVREMMEAYSGIYLAPLRLLALENQEKLLDNNVVCSLLTGEEESIQPDANHMSCTVEMMDEQKYYDVAVIDEAQMIADKDRGWAWTRAILGVYSPRVHICMADEAKNIVIRLIELCNDEYEVVEHHRDTELVYEKMEFSYPNGVMNKDALIVFSRKSVLAVAAELKKAGVTASIIYGSLPYAARRNEIDKFVSGKTSVIVSTDAIGMGMNLPIRRVVFLEMDKFDGVSRRPLEVQEIRQIAGRAGRRGIFDTGYVNSAEEKGRLKWALYKATPESIPTARIQLPVALTELDMKLSEIVMYWSNLEDQGIFYKTDSSELLKKVEFLEEKCKTLSKLEMLKLSSLPFDEGNDIIFEIWEKLCLAYVKGDIHEHIYDYLMMDIVDSTDLTALEQNYKVYDLYFSFGRAVKVKEEFKSFIVEEKMRTAGLIIENLESQIENNQKVCAICGNQIPWRSRGGLCSSCRRVKYAKVK